MTVNWADLAATMAMIMAGFAIGYLVLHRRLQRGLDEQRRAIDHELEVVVAALKSMERKLAAQNRAPDVADAFAAEFGMSTSLEAAAEPSPALVEQPMDLAEEAVTPEMMAVLAAAVAEFLGKKVRVVSARKLQSPHPGMSAWSQQGRVFVQASHNLR